MDTYYDFCQEDLFYENLKKAAFEVLRENYGLSQAEWASELINSYPRVVTEALDGDPCDVFASLADLWEEDYYDDNTRLTKKFCEWANVFCTEEAVDIYNESVEVRCRFIDILTKIDIGAAKMKTDEDYPTELIEAKDEIISNLKAKISMLEKTINLQQDLINAQNEIIEFQRKINRIDK